MIMIMMMITTDLQVPTSPGLPTAAQQSVKPSLAISPVTAVFGDSQLFSRLDIKVDEIGLICLNAA